MKKTILLPLTLVALSAVFTPFASAKAVNVPAPFQASAPFLAKVAKQAAKNNQSNSNNSQNNSQNNNQNNQNKNSSNTNTNNNSTTQAASTQSNATANTTATLFSIPNTNLVINTKKLMAATPKLKAKIKAAATIAATTGTAGTNNTTDVTADVASDTKQDPTPSKPKEITTPAPTEMIQPAKAAPTESSVETKQTTHLTVATPSKPKSISVASEFNSVLVSSPASSYGYNLSSLSQSSKFKIYLLGILLALAGMLIARNKKEEQVAEQAFEFQQSN